MFVATRDSFPTSNARFIGGDAIRLHVIMRVESLACMYKRIHYFIFSIKVRKVNVVVCGPFSRHTNCLELCGSYIVHGLVRGMKFPALTCLTKTEGGREPWYFSTLWPRHLRGRKFGATPLPMQALRDGDTITEIELTFMCLYASLVTRLCAKVSSTLDFQPHPEKLWSLMCTDLSE